MDAKGRKWLDGWGTIPSDPPSLRYGAASLGLTQLTLTRLDLFLTLMGCGRG